MVSAQSVRRHGLDPAWCGADAWRSLNLGKIHEGFPKIHVIKGDKIGFVANRDLVVQQVDSSGLAGDFWASTVGNTCR